MHLPHTDGHGSFLGNPCGYRRDSEVIGRVVREEENGPNDLSIPAHQQPRRQPRVIDPMKNMEGDHSIRGRLKLASTALHILRPDDARLGGENAGWRRAERCFACGLWGGEELAAPRAGVGQAVVTTRRADVVGTLWARRR